MGRAHARALPLVCSRDQPSKDADTLRQDDPSSPTSILQWDLSPREVERVGGGLYTSRDALRRRMTNKPYAAVLNCLALSY